jgi:very-short-patch-repair endonuclease
MRIPNISKWKSKYWLKRYNLNQGIDRIKKRMKYGKYNDPHQLLQARNTIYKFELRSYPTKAEIAFGDHLWRRGIYFIFQKGFFTPYHIIVDFFLPEQCLVFEIDGGYHKNIVEKDNYRDNTFFEKRGIKTVRIKNEEVFDGTFVNKLNEALKYQPSKQSIVKFNQRSYKMKVGKDYKKVNIQDREKALNLRRLLRRGSITQDYFNEKIGIL